MKTNSIAVLIKTASIEFDKISNPIFSEYNITMSQYRVLKFLYAQPEQSARVVDIEKSCSITHPTVLGLLKSLEKNGFISRTVNPDDARSKVIILTDKAKNMQSELEGVGNKIEGILTDSLSDDEKGQLRGLLQKLLKV